MDDLLKLGLRYWWRAKKEKRTDPIDGNDENDVFGSYYNTGLFLFFQMFFGLLIVTFMMKRKRKWLDCARGHFALAIPVNFLEDRKRRRPLIAAFAIVATTIISVLQVLDFGGYTTAVKLMFKLSMVSVIGCYFFPLFASIHLATLPACIFGLTYHLMILVIVVLNAIPAPGLSTKALIKELLLSSIVYSTSGPSLVYWFTKRIYQYYKKSIRSEDIPITQLKYVGNLFLPKEKYFLLQGIGPIDKTSGYKIVYLFRKYVYRNIPGFRYSLTILVSCTIGFLAITQLSIMLLYGVIKNIIEVLDLLDKLKEFMQTNIPNFVQVIVEAFTNSKTEDSEYSENDITEISFYDFFYCQSLIILVESILAGLLAYVLSVVTICRLLTSYRKNVTNLSKRKQNQSTLNVSQGVTNINLVRSAIQYGGYQVAYLLAGFSIQLIALHVILLILLEFIIIPIQFAFSSFVLKVVELVTPIIIALILIPLVQYVLIKYHFLEDQGKTMALNNRRGFFIMSYFVFFYNIFTGVFSCAKRVFKGAVIGVFLLPRLDVTIFPRMFEKADPGFRAYSCLLHLEALQSNAIVTIFVYILLKKLGNSQAVAASYSRDSGISLDIKDRASERRKLARTRWFVAYTLIRNPSIACFRGHKSDPGRPTSVELDSVAHWNKLDMTPRIQMQQTRSETGWP